MGRVIVGKGASCVARGDELDCDWPSSRLSIDLQRDRQTELRARKRTHPRVGAYSDITSARSEMRREAGSFYALGKDQAKQEIKKWYVPPKPPNSDAPPISLDRCRDVLRFGVPRSTEHHALALQSILAFRSLKELKDGAPFLMQAIHLVVTSTQPLNSFFLPSSSGESIFRLASYSFISYSTFVLSLSFGHCSPPPHRRGRIKANFKTEQNRTVAREFVYRQYQQFCIDQNIESTTQSAFGRILKDVYPEVPQCRQVVCFCGQESGPFSGV